MCLRCRVQPDVQLEEIFKPAFQLVAFAVGGGNGAGGCRQSPDPRSSLLELANHLPGSPRAAVESSVQQQRFASAACYIFRDWRCLKCGFSSGHSLCPLIAAHTCTHTKRSSSP